MTVVPPLHLVEPGESARGRTAGGPGLTALALVAVVAVGLSPSLVGMDDVRLAITGCLVLAAAMPLLASRPASSALTWVVAYVVLQFPLRALFLLTVPEERPPLYAALSPGVGLEPALVTALLQAMAGLGAMAVAYLLSTSRAEASQPPVVAELRLGRAYGVLGCGALLLPLEIARHTEGASTSGGDFVLTMPGLAASGAAAAILFTFARRPGQTWFPSLLATVYCAVRVVELGSKLALLAGLVALVLGLSTRTGPRRQQGVGRRLVLALLAGCALLVATYAFAAANGPQGREGGLVATLERGGQNAVSRSYGIDALVAVDLHLDRGGALLHGSSLTELSYSWVPRALWPDKPKSFSIRFGEEVFSFSSLAGRSFFAPGYSGEWKLNFGLLGLLAGWALFGVLVGRIDMLPSAAHRMLWLLVVVHVVEGSLVAQFWLAAPYLIGGYAVLTSATGRRPVRSTPRG